MTNKVILKAGKNGTTLPLPEQDLLAMYEIMVLNRHLDERCLKLQRSGRISFYVPQIGQEAAQIGSAFALRTEDWIVPAYREPGTALVKGITVRQLLDQYFGTVDDLCKGRQMPNHYAFKDHNYASVSSPIGTQISHAAGLAMAFQIKNENKVAISYFGDGATSSNDFHAGLTFAGVHKAPVIFFCNNNGWAISMPTKDQCAVENLADKAAGYGMPGIQVDGNDVLAVYTATKAAVDRARAGHGPTMIEAITYRMGPHSTSDDPTRYRDSKEVDEWAKKDPIDRFKALLMRKGILDEATAQEYYDNAVAEVAEAINAAQTADSPDLETLFEDVYEDMPWHLKEQQDSMDIN